MRKYPKLTGKLALRPLPPQVPDALTITSVVALSILTPLGGIIRFVHARSAHSLVAGLSIGALYLFSFTRLRNRQTWGEEIGLLTSSIWGLAAMSRALRTSGRSVPARLIPALYGVVVFCSAFNEKRVAATNLSESA
jgi:uncharacterized membrane protein (UPF0136 family)